MPLIDVYLRLSYRIRIADDKDQSTLGPDKTRFVIMSDFARSLTYSFYKNREALGLDKDTPFEAIQLMCHDFDKFDLNIPSVWVKVQFTEPLPDKQKRDTIRDIIFDILVDWFTKAGYAADGLVLDLLWGPTSGKGVVNGVIIEW